MRDILIPALIPKSKEEIDDFVSSIKKYYEYVQIDLTDGVYVENKSWPFINGDIKALDLEIEYELDLMVEDPIETMQKLSSSTVSKYIVHYASTKNVAACAEMAAFWQKDISFAVTVLDNIDDFIGKMREHNIRDIQCMGIEKIGVQGEQFTERALDMIGRIRKDLPESHITVDGGVKVENAAKILKAGANNLVSGSGLLKGDLVSNRRDFSKALISFKKV